MDDRTGQIYSPDQIRKMLQTMPDSERQHYHEMGIPPTAAQMRRRPPHVGRNDPCPCGSGRKFKRCCLRKG